MLLGHSQVKARRGTYGKSQPYHTGTHGQPLGGSAHSLFVEQEDIKF